MRIKVEIGDDVQEHTYERNGIFVGADSRCHLVLPYEEIALKHLKIVNKDSKTYIQDLNTGEKTYYNNVEVPPGGIVEFNTFFPIEIGGIFIYLLDDINVELQREASLNSVADVLGSEDDEPVEGDVASKEAENSFKRDLFADSSNSTSSETTKNNSTRELRQVKANVTGTRKINTQVNIKNRKRRSKREKEKVKSIALKTGSLRGLMIFFLGVFVVGGIYYKKIYSENLLKQSSTSIVKEEIKLLINNPKIKEHKKNILESLSRTKCDDKLLEEVCNLLEKDIDFSAGYHVNSINGVVYIGLEREPVLEFLNKLSPYDDSEIPRLEELVKEGYSNIIDWTQFTNNSFSSQVPALLFKRKKYKGSLGLIKVILETKSFTAIDNKVDKIFLYLKNSIGLGEIEVTDVLIVDPAIYSFKQEQIDENNFLFKTVVNSNLTENVLDYISTFGETADVDFSSKEFEFFKKTRAFSQFESIISKVKCRMNFETKLCDLRKGQSGFEGIVLEGEVLYIVSDVSRIRSTQSEFDELVYDGRDKKIVSNIFRSTSVPGQDYENFYQSGFIANVSDEVFYRNLLLSDLLQSPYLNLIVENKEINKVVLVGASIAENGSTPVEGVAILNRTILDSDWSTKYKDLVKYIPRSKIDVFYRLERVEF
jgi:hypothetical protein